MTTAITLYGQPRCDPCRLARKVLDRAQVPYTYVDLTERPDLVDAFRQAGHLQTPILQTPTTTTSGFNPDAYTRAVAEARALESGTAPTPAVTGPSL